MKRRFAILLVALLIAPAAHAGPRSAGSLSPASLPPSKRPIYRDYLPGGRKADFKLDEAAWQSTWKAIERSCIYPAPASGLLRGVLEEAADLARQAHCPTVPLQKLPLDPTLPRRILATYGRTIDPNLLWYAMLRGLVRGLHDPAGRVWTPRQYQAELQPRPRLTVGVGLRLDPTRRTPSGPVVLEVLDGSPAARAGVRASDAVVEVDGVPCAGMDAAEVGLRMQGPLNGPLRLTLARNGKRHTARMMRQALRVEPLSARMLDASTALLRVRALDETLPAALDRTLERLRARGMRALVLDLRDTPGGSILAAIALCGRFAPGHAPVVTVLSRTDEPRRYHVNEPGGQRIPMIVLVSRRTAGEAEVAAACLRDQAGARLLGDTTAGHGGVPAVLRLPDGSAVRLTLARYSTARGVIFDGRGLAPDLLPEPHPLPGVDPLLMQGVRALVQP